MNIDEHLFRKALLQIVYHLYAFKPLSRPDKK